MLGLFGRWIAFGQLWIQIAADCAFVVASVELPGGIAEKGAQAAASVFGWNGCNFVLGRCAGGIRADDHVAVGVAVFTPSRKLFAHQAGAIAFWHVFRRGAQHPQ